MSGSLAQYIGPSGDRCFELALIAGAWLAALLGVALSFGRSSRKAAPGLFIASLSLTVLAVVTRWWANDFDIPDTIGSVIITVMLWYPAAVLFVAAVLMAGVAAWLARRGPQRYK
jgi:hypothetical protein